MDEYYKEHLGVGNEYEHFIDNYYKKELDTDLGMHWTKTEQHNIGENKYGMEIKYDSIMERTGNLYIEIAEKPSPNVINYSPSGILRNDNSQLYGIGNYSVFYIFNKQFLIEIYKSSKYKEIEIDRKTSKGFLIPIKNAEKMVEEKIIFKTKKIQPRWP